MAFVVGTAGGEWLELPAGDPAGTRQLRKPLLLESFLLLAALGCHWRADVFGNDWCVVFLCLGMGLQNGALRRCGVVGVHTTFITGMSTSLLTTALKDATGKEPPADKDRQTVWTLGSVLLTFAAGAGVGAFLNFHLPVWGFVGIFVPLLAALLAAWRG